MAYMDPMGMSIYNSSSEITQARFSFLRCFNAMFYLLQDECIDIYGCFQK